MTPRPLNVTTRVALGLLWLGLLLAAGIWQSRHLQMSGDLRRFMPSPRTPEQKLMLDELGEGPGSRLMLIGLRGAAPEALAAQSKAMRSALARDAQFSLVANGPAGLDAIPERLRPYRYLLSPTVDEAGAFGAVALREALMQRMADLGSPAAGLVEPLIPADPTLEMLKVAEALAPANGPQVQDDVWFDKTGREALMVVQTHAAGFDPKGQQLAVDAVNAAHAKARGNGPGTLVMTGPGPFGVEIGNRTAGEANRIGLVDSISLLVLLIVAYRSWRTPLFGALPLLSAGIGGLAAVALLFEGIHGITVAFGFTLIGVVQDYPIHLFSHQHKGLSPWDNARAIWPTLATGVASTCIAYLTFLFSGVDGLKQLSVFTITGLLVAALSTRLLLPALIDPAPRDPADSRALARLWARVERLPRPPGWLQAALAALALAVIVFAPATVWQNDLSKLTPVPAEGMREDMHLRGELGAPDVGFVMALEAPTPNAALTRSEAMRPALDALVREGKLSGYDMAARYLPSSAVQRARQARLPQPDALRRALGEAVAGTDFREDVFAPFLGDVETARTAPPLTLAALRGSPLETTVGGLLLERDGHATALVSLSGIRDPAVLPALAKASGASLIDMKQASESLVMQYRQGVLWSLGAAAVLLVATVWFALRSPQRVRRVLVPMALALLLILAFLRGFGVELTLFHLVAFILAAGLGLDYALFFEHAGDNLADQLRTGHALIVCSLTTFLVFFLLALSSIPVLRAIGVTVTLGVFLNFVLALLIAREPLAVPAENAHA